MTTATATTFTSQAVQVRYSSGRVTTFHSLSAASRALTGRGSDSLRRTITRRCDEGGGYVGKVHVRYAS